VRAAPLEAPKISREQLVLRARGDECIEVENLGRARLRVNEQETATAMVRENDTIQIGSQLLLLCVRRPAWIPAWDDLPHHHFGLPDPYGIVGESPGIWQIRRQIAFAAALPGHVLVSGASGTGKELVACAIHDASPRARRQLVSRNAATFPETLIDAELFGNVKNYPNPGTPDRPGLVGEAHGSTLFLDEIGELPAAAQAHLLRVLDSGEYQRLGDARVQRSDARFIVATNHAGGLRHDFAPRLKLRIDLPDLNARREDIPLIADHLVARLVKRHSDVCRKFLASEASVMPRLSLDFARALVVHRFTGNVREVEAFLWQSVQESHSNWLACPRDLSEKSTAVSVSSDSASRGQKENRMPRAKPIDPRSLEISHVQACLDRHRGAIEPTWRALGLSSRHALARLIKRYGLRTR
jgi:two-component system nitrogen regulation response regulator GlnG/two-component system response regulator HydG